MHLVLVGISHRTAPGRTCASAWTSRRGGLDVALRALAARPSVRETLVLSTCNRAEVYAACDDLEEARHDLVEFICEFHDVDPSTVRPATIYEAADPRRGAPSLYGRLGPWIHWSSASLKSWDRSKRRTRQPRQPRWSDRCFNRLCHFSFGVGKRVAAPRRGLGSGAAGCR